MNLPDYVASYWQDRDGELLVGGVSASLLAARYGTPVFLYDRNVVDRKYAALRRALPSRFDICYSVKANPHPAFLKLFIEKRCGLEIASGGEFHQARRAGCAARDVLFAGPGKTESELALVISQGIGEIHVESSREVERVSTISNNLGHCTAVAVRVNPSEEARGGAMTMGGKPAPFGVDEEQLEPILRRVAADSHLAFAGIHLFIGTQILGHELLLAQYRKGVEIAKFASGIAGSKIRTLDFGGGLGIPYFAGDQELDLPQLAQGLQALMAEIEKESCFEQTRFIVEPGRFLVGECGVYVARITDIKTSRGKKYLVVDGGMNHHLAASGNLGQIVKRNFPIAIVNKLDQHATETVDVVGPLCTPLDTLGRSVQAPPAQVGDLVGIFQSGAYARSASPLGFLSHVSPPEVWVEDQRDFLIRRRGEAEDYIRDTLPVEATVNPTA
jgi:diaminopimelate decarboxylase